MTPDELLPAAARLVADTQFGSVAMLQRRLCIGFGRASMLMDALEEMGIVGPAQTGPRDVLVGVGEVEEILAWVG